MRDYLLEPTSMAAERLLPLVPSVAASVTARPCAIVPITAPSLVTRVVASCRDVAGVVSARVVLSGGDGVFSTPGLAIDAVPEDFQLAAFSGRQGSTFFSKAAETGIDFTAAHVVTATLFGIILVQVTPAGVVSTKVPAATPTTAMEYATAAAAVAALPAPDAGNIAVGYILIEADAGDWTANTDSMTDDLTAATFVSVAQTAQEALATPVTFVDGQAVSGTLATSNVAKRANTGDFAVLLVTGDGSAALTDAQVFLGLRPFPLKGEVWQAP
jgi:hypothetical protein